MKKFLDVVVTLACIAPFALLLDMFVYERQSLIYQFAVWIGN